MYFKNKYIKEFNIKNFTLKFNFSNIILLDLHIKKNRFWLNYITGYVRYLFVKTNFYIEEYFDEDKYVKKS
jgi:hypothetical protein